MNWNILTRLSAPKAEEEAALESAFAGRPILTDEEYYQRFFAESDVQVDVVVGVRNTFIRRLELDMRRLEPDDNFSDELNFVWRYDSLADVEVVIELEKRFAIELSEFEAQQTVTLRQIALLVDQKVKAKVKAA